MEALAIYSSAKMGRILSMKKCFEIDLSNATLDEVIDEWVKYKKKTKPDIHKRLFSLRKHLRLLQEEFKVNLEPWQVTDLFYAEFQNRMSCVSHMKNSSINVICAQLRSILSWGALHGVRVSSTFDKYEHLKHEVNRVVLTADEVSLVYHYDINTINVKSQKKKTLEKVRDQFVLCCNLGQRYSDIRRISPECFTRNKFKIKQQKTQGNLCVDVDKMAIDKETVYEILEKYKWYAPYNHDIGNYNKYLKFLLQNIGGRFDKQVRIDEKFGDKIITKYYPKWKLIASHAGRRSFSTYNVLKGIPEAIIRKSTGHRSSQAFERYIQIDEDDL